MPEFDRLSGCIEWIDLSFVESQQTPERAIQVGIWCILPTCKREMQVSFYRFWVPNTVMLPFTISIHKAGLRPILTMDAGQLAVNEKGDLHQQW